MSKADDMFKELGYEKEEVNDRITGTFLMYNKKTELKLIRISFFKDKTVQCSESYSYVAKIDMQELKAINKKVSELGWRKDRKDYFHKYYLEKIKTKRKGLSDV